MSDGGNIYCYMSKTRSFKCKLLSDTFVSLGLDVTVVDYDCGAYRYEYVALGAWPDVGHEELVRRASMWFEFANGDLEGSPAVSTQYETFREMGLL